MSSNTAKAIEIVCNSTYLLGLIKREGEYQSIIMESTAEILSRLKLLSHIQKGEKLAVRNMTLQVDSWYTRFMRTWISPDNRQNSLKMIREVISRSFEILFHNIESKKESDIYQCKMIVTDLQKSQYGLLNMKATYSDDIKFGCDVDILLQQIMARLTEVKKMYVHLFDVDPLEQPIERKEESNTL